MQVQYKVLQTYLLQTPLDDFQSRTLLRNEQDTLSVSNQAADQVGNRL
jgi:hypothetical protein